MKTNLSRRELIAAVGKLGAAGLAVPLLAAAAPDHPPELKLGPLLAPSEREGDASQPLPPDRKVGFAVVGIGHLALGQILPGFEQSDYGRVAAVVSGDRAKAAAVARRYGVRDHSIYSYQTYDRLRDNPDVQAIYIVLPNGLHAEYSIRGAQAGKHILCEKPMANSVAECESMIAACRKAAKLLMIAYRMQYEPFNRNAIQQIRDGMLGPLRSFDSENGQDVGDPSQWRLKKALSGGGCLPDVGIYCLNAARYLSGEEPSEVFEMSHASPDDPRFREVEETFNFALRFPSGLIANATSGYGNHRTQRYRVLGTEGWLEMDPAFAYSGLRQRFGHKSKTKGAEEIIEQRFDEKNQFAREIDHFARCILETKLPRTPGEEGLQDMRVIGALYESAREGRAVKVPPPPQPTRGPQLESEA